MQKTIPILILKIWIISPMFGQNVNIGNEKPTIARFEVSGVAGSGKTTAIFTPTE